MRKYAFFILLLVTAHNVCISQDMDDKCLIRQRYLMAYEYIQSDSIARGKSIHVMNAVVMIHRVSFIKDLEKYPLEREMAEADRTNYAIFDTERHDPPLPVDLGIPENTYADFILIYSEVKDNMLVVELVPRKKYNDEYSRSKPLNDLDVQGFKIARSHFPNTPREALMFTHTYQYLFLFDEDGTIKDVFRHEGIYG